MGLYENLYLGVNIEVEYKIIAVMKTRTVCERNGHEDEQDGEFCPKCGSMIIEEDVAVSQPLTFSDMFEWGEGYSNVLPISEDDFFAVNADENEGAWLIINRTRSKYNKGLDDEEGFIDIHDTPDDIIHDFKLEYADLLSALEKHCKSVKVRYGLIKYYY